MTAIGSRHWFAGRDRTADITGLGIGVLIALAFGHDDGLIICPFRRCTGGYCPLCGTTRAAFSLARLDVSTAWARHPFTVLVLAQLATVVGFSALGGTVSRLFRTRLLLGNVVLVLVIWAVRLSTSDIPPPTSLQLPF